MKKLNPYLVRWARAWRGELKQHSIGKIIGCCPSNVHYVQVRKTWKDVK